MKLFHLDFKDDKWEELRRSWNLGCKALHGTTSFIKYLGDIDRRLIFQQRLRASRSNDDHKSPLHWGDCKGADDKQFLGLWVR